MEYAIVASLIAAVIVAVVLAVGQKTDKMFCDTNDAWADVPNADPARCP